MAADFSGSFILPSLFVVFILLLVRNDGGGRGVVVGALRWRSTAEVLDVRMGFLFSENSLCCWAETCGTIASEASIVAVVSKGSGDLVQLYE